MSWETVAAGLGALIIVSEAVIRLMRAHGQYATKEEVNLLALRVENVEESIRKLEEQIWRALKRIEQAQSESRKEVRDDFKELKTNVSSVIGRKNDG